MMTNLKIYFKETIAANSKLYPEITTYLREENRNLLVFKDIDLQDKLRMNPILQ